MFVTHKAKIIVAVLILLVVSNAILLLANYNISRSERRIQEAVENSWVSLTNLLHSEIEKIEAPIPEQGPQGLRGIPGQSIKGEQGEAGKDSTVPGPAGQDSVVPGPAGEDGKDGVDGVDGENGRTPEFLQLPNGTLLWRYVGDANWQVVPGL